MILKWYKESHSVKGKSVFLEQMKKFVEWLENAEEGNRNSSYNIYYSPFQLYIILFQFSSSFNI